MNAEGKVVGSGAVAGRVGGSFRPCGAGGGSRGGRTSAAAVTSTGRAGAVGAGTGAAGVGTREGVGRQVWPVPRGSPAGMPVARVYPASLIRPAHVIVPPMPDGIQVVEVVHLPGAEHEGVAGPIRDRRGRPAGVIPGGDEVESDPCPGWPRLPFDP
jgi:hypothetical protein